MGKTVGLKVSGGMGDILQNYLVNPISPTDFGDGCACSASRVALWFRRLPDFRLKHPEIGIMVIVKSTNSASSELFVCDPNIDVVVNIKDSVNLVDCYRDELFGMSFIYQQYKWKDYSPSEPGIYLTNMERRILDNVLYNGRYVVLHPFCGDKERNLCSPDWFYNLAKELIRMKFNVVVLGGSYGGLELFDYDMLGLYNFVNKANARLCAALVIGANGFVGHDSSMANVAWIKKKPNVALLQLSRKAIFYDVHDVAEFPTVWGTWQPFTDKVFIDKPDECDYVEVADRLMGKIND